MLAELECESLDWIMKITTLILLTVLAALLSQTASADDRWGRGYGRHYNYGYRSHNYFGNRHYGHWGSYIGFSIGGSHHHDSFSTSSFLGGLVLGSVLTYPRYSKTHNYYRSTPVRSSSQVTVISRTSGATVAPGRRLLRDLEGRCYDILRDENGDEIRTELEPEACSF